MTDNSFVYDIFISYAREDYDWVYESLYLPLTQCVMPNGKKPKIFLDQSEIGIKIGEDFLEALAKAILTSHRVILVYSKKYFEKPMTQWELTKALQADPTGRAGKINPILLEHETESKIPFSINHIQYLDVQKQPDQWCQRLITNMALTRLSEKRTIILQTNPGSSLVNNTIPPVKVSLSDRELKQFEEETLEIFSDFGDIQGTCKQKTVNGIAEFSDLSFNSPADSVRITIRAPGYEPLISNTFTVHERKAMTAAQCAGSKDDKPVVIPYSIEPSQTLVYCFENGLALAVSDGSTIRIYNPDGKCTGQIQQYNQIKCIATQKDKLVLVDWKGNMYFLSANGSAYSVALIPDDVTFSIPGEVILTDSHAYIGMWNGDFIKAETTDRGRKEVLFRHNAGIQKFVTKGETVCLCDFDGNFVMYANGHQANAFSIERSVAGMFLFTNYVIIIGELKPYQFSFREGRILSSQHHAAPSASAVRIGNHVLSLDDAGRGIFRDEELFAGRSFHVNAGASPWCTGMMQNDTYCSFAYPDGRYALLKNDRIVYTNVSGILAFNADLSILAAGMRDGIMIRNGSWIKEITREVV